MSFSFFFSAYILYCPLNYFSRYIVILAICFNIFLSLFLRDTDLRKSSICLFCSHSWKKKVWHMTLAMKTSSFSLVKFTHTSSVRLLSFPLFNLFFIYIWCWSSLSCLDFFFFFFFFFFFLVGGGGASFAGELQVTMVSNYTFWPGLKEDKKCNCSLCNVSRFPGYIVSQK